MIAFVFQPGRNGKKVRFYSAKIKLDKWPKVRVFALRTSDKRVADEKLRTLLLEFEREAEGILAPRAMREATKLPLAELAAAFLADLKARGRAKQTLRRYRLALRRLFQLGGWQRLADITPASFSRVRANPELSPKYLNDLLGVACSWLNWLVREERLPRNPLADVGRVRVIGGEEYRRALTPDEFRRLVASAPTQRATMYLLIGYTGLRRDELNKLPFSAFDLVDASPVLNVPAELTKNKKPAIIPLRSELVKALRDFWPELVMPYEFVFRGKVPSPAKLREDLAKIGVPYVDHQGRRLDVHALRKTFITMGAASGMSPQVLKILARHSELRLTLGAYTDDDKMPLRAAIDGLPSISLPEKRTQNHTQTGAISAQISAFQGISCHFLANAQDSVTVSATPTKAPLFPSSHNSEMVGVARFELAASTSRT